jgi:flagellar biosynthetic protein FliR
VLFDSFAAIPPMSPFLMAGGAGSDGLLDFAIEVMREMFDLSLRLAGPAIAALLITSLIMGFITKTMPQLNILSVGFSFKIATALLIVAVTIAHSGDVLAAAVMDGMDYVRSWLAAAAEDLKHGG